MDIINILTIFLIIVLGVFIYLKSLYNYWQKKGLDYLEPEFFYGNTKQLLKRELSKNEQYHKIYKELRAKGLKHGGIYACFKPVYVPVDLELIKCVVQKDFGHFMNHVNVSNTSRPLSRNLFSLGGSAWRNLRVKLTETFTSGKMRMMFPTLVECTSGLNKILGEYADIQEPVNIKEILSRFTMDIIGSCAFGINCNCMTNPDSEFIKYSQKVFKPDFKTKLKLSLALFLPTYVLRVLNVSTITKDIESFFLNTIKDTVEYRERNNIFRKDFLHLLLQLKNMGTVTDDERLTSEKQENQLSDFTINDIAAQCFVFFLAGYGTSATAITFALYELSIRQDIQEKLRQDIKSVLKQHDGKLTYEAIKDMTYLDKVVNETLRKHPPGGSISRTCSEVYRIPGTDVIIEPGTEVYVSILGVHHDPEYYPNPDVFDPERFTEENKATRPSYSFIPFGEGPRICIGSRFALLQTKIALISVIGNYRITLNRKTSTPLKYDPHARVTTVKGGVWLNVSKLE